MSDCASASLRPCVAEDAVSVDPQDEGRLAEWARSDPQAFAEIYRRHYQPVARYLYRRTGDVHATEDLVADVFFTALRTIGRYRWRGVPLRHWLYRIATNAANRWAARRRTLVVHSLEAAAIHADREAGRALEGATKAANDGPDIERVQAALLALPIEHQTVVTLHYLEGFAIAEVAAIVGCREGTVKSRLARAREALRRRLSEKR